MTSWLKTLGALAGASVLALALGGCAPEERQPVVDDLTVEQAKAQSQEWEMRIAKHVRGEDVERTEQAEFGSLRSCDTDGTYRWTGNTFVYLKRPLSGEEADQVTTALADSLAEFADGESGYTVTTHDSSGSIDVEVFGPDGAVYRAWVLPDAEPEGVAIVNVTSASPCFVLPDDIHPGEKI